MNATDKEIIRLEEKYATLFHIYMIIYIIGRTKAGHIQSVNVQLNAYFPNQFFCDPINTINNILKMYYINSASNQIINQRGYITI